MMTVIQKMKVLVEVMAVVLTQTQILIQTVVMEIVNQILIVLQTTANMKHFQSERQILNR